MCPPIFGWLTKRDDSLKREPKGSQSQPPFLKTPKSTAWEGGVWTDQHGGAVLSKWCSQPPMATHRPKDWGRVPFGLSLQHARKRIWALQTSRPHLKSRLHLKSGKVKSPHYWISDPTFHSPLENTLKAPKSFQRPCCLLASGLIVGHL